jgi:predicted ester cyclase
MDHAGTLRRMYDLINAHDIDAFGEFLADDFVEHEELPAGGPTKEGVKAFFHMQIAAFPDFATGTHEGEFMGMPATGRTVDVPLIDVMRFADDGLVHEHWGVFDAMAMMQQLGAAAG